MWSLVRARRRIRRRVITALYAASWGCPRLPPWRRPTGRWRSDPTRAAECRYWAVPSRDRISVALLGHSDPQWDASALNVRAGVAAHSGPYSSECRPQCARRCLHDRRWSGWVRRLQEKNVVVSASDVSGRAVWGTDGWPRCLSGCYSPMAARPARRASPTMAAAAISQLRLGGADCTTPVYREGRVPSWLRDSRRGRPRQRRWRRFEQERQRRWPATPA